MSQIYSIQMTEGSFNMNVKITNATFCKKQILKNIYLRIYGTEVEITLLFGEKRDWKDLWQNLIQDEPISFNKLR